MENSISELLTPSIEDCGCNKVKENNSDKTLLFSFRAPKKDHVKWVNIISTLLAENNIELDRFESCQYQY